MNRTVHEHKTGTVGHTWLPLWLLWRGLMHVIWLGSHLLFRRRTALATYLIISVSPLSIRIMMTSFMRWPCFVGTVEWCDYTMKKGAWAHISVAGQYTAAKSKRATHSDGIKNARDRICTKITQTSSIAWAWYVQSNKRYSLMAGLIRSWAHS